MNNYKIYMIALGLAGMGLASCTADFLDVESKVGFNLLIQPLCLAICLWMVSSR